MHCVHCTAQQILRIDSPAIAACTDAAARGRRWPGAGAGRRRRRPESLRGRRDAAGWRQRWRAGAPAPRGRARCRRRRARGASLPTEGQRERAGEEHRRAAPRSCATGSSRCRWRRTGCPRRRCRTTAPMSAPLPCWISTRPIIASAASICTASTTVGTRFMSDRLLMVCARPRAQPARAADRRGSRRPSSDAPPIRPPSMSGCANSCAALSALTLPP